MKRFYLSLAALLLTAQSVFATSLPVHVATSNGNVDLSLELVTTPSTREHGLMDRKTLKPYDGMLFVFPTADHLYFWMKNTLIPLDMLFIDPQGEIVRIAVKTTPLSLDPIDSRKPVLSVIELDGGRAAKSGIAVGDKVTYELPANTHVE